MNKHDRITVLISIFLNTLLVVFAIYMGPARIIYTALFAVLISLLTAYTIFRRCLRKISVWWFVLIFVISITAASIGNATIYKTSQEEATIVYEDVSDCEITDKYSDGYYGELQFVSNKQIQYVPVDFSKITINASLAEAQKVTVVEETNKYTPRVLKKVLKTTLSSESRVEKITID